MVDISPGLQGLNFMLKGLKALIDIREEVRRNHAILDLQRQAIELHGHISAAEQEKAALLKRVGALEAEIADLKAGSAELERYELKDIGGGASAYMLKPEMRGAEPPHWLCPACYASGKKSLYQFSTTFRGGQVYRCTQCRGHVTTRGEPTWS